jgi:hypothetical protein
MNTNYIDIDPVNDGIILRCTGNIEGKPFIGNPVVNFCIAGGANDLIALIEGADLGNNVKNSLIGPIKKVQKILSDGNDANNDAACGKLDEFIANVGSKESSGHLLPYYANLFLYIAQSKMRGDQAHNAGRGKVLDSEKGIPISLNK